MSRDPNIQHLKSSKRWLHRATLPIVGGPNAGLWWSMASGGKIARVVLGSYETDQTSVMSASLSPGDVFLDIGAHHGYFTLMASRRVGPQGRVLAFEPNPGNAFFLNKHVRNNHLANVEVVESAVGAENGTISFTQGSGTGTGHIGGDGEITVQLARLDDVLAKANLSPTHMKIDVEGAEVDVLEGAQRTLMNDRPVIFLSTHGDEVHAACCQVLQSLDYHLSPIRGTDLEATCEIYCLPAEMELKRAA